MRPAPLALALVLSAAVVAAASCSDANREGPDVTCEDLECGRVNACEQGIIASCVDGTNVRWHVCSVPEACEAGWQIPGQYRCGEDFTDCEGCRPERELGCGEGGVGPDGGGGAGGGA